LEITLTHVVGLSAVAQVSETLLGLRGAADILGLSTVRVRQFISGGRLPATKVSSTWIIKESDLLAFAEHERGPGRPRLYELIIDQTEAHISVRGGRSTGICGSERCDPVPPVREMSRSSASVRSQILAWPRSELTWM
jgi:hypothetical protein